MGCDILDVRCMMVNEIIGDPKLSILIAILAYLAIAISLKWSWNVVLVIGIPILLGLSTSIYGFSSIYTLLAMLAGLFAALALMRLIGNK